MDRTYLKPVFTKMVPMAMPTVPHGSVAEDDDSILYVALSPPAFSPHFSLGVLVNGGGMPFCRSSLSHERHPACAT